MYITQYLLYNALTWDEYEILLLFSLGFLTHVRIIIYVMGIYFTTIFYHDIDMFSIINNLIKFKHEIEY